MYVVLDSNVIIQKDWHLTSPAALVLLAASRDSGVHLALPELVIREVATKHREREQATIAKLESTRRSLIALQAAFSSDDRVPVEPVSDSWAADFRVRLRDALTEILPLDSASHDELIERALARRRPFDGEGRAGYRDALIWYAVLRLADKDEVVFVSDDGHFAGDGGTLHPDLRDDLVARGLAADRVRLFGSLTDAVRAVFTPAEELLEALDNRLADDASFHDLLLDELQEARHYGYGEIAPDLDIALETDAEPYERWIRDFDLTDLVSLKNLRLLRAYPADQDSFIVELTVEADAHFRVELSTEGWYERPPQAEFELSTDERSFYAAGMAAVSLEYWSRYSRVKNDFEEHDLVHIGGA